jgi:predicted transcriptional regulator
MFKIKEILRLKYEAKLSNRKIAKVLNISHSVVNEYVKSFTQLPKEYEKIQHLDDSGMSPIN